MQAKRILVAPLNWGLGHATRCIPLIIELQKNGFQPVIGSDGAALELLKQEFPQLEYVALPSYNIKYSRRGFFLKSKLLLQAPHIYRTINREKKATAQIVEKMNIGGIISDSRFGVWHPEIPKVFVTHQLRVLSGKTTFWSSRLHSHYIKKYDACWIPDSPGENNLSGKLGHLSKHPAATNYLGILSRFERKEAEMKYDILILLSGPEPQRSILEKILLREFRNDKRQILFIRGIFSEENIREKNPGLEILNYLAGSRLELALNSSRLVICRSGYTSLMDLAKLSKKAFFIPTPGQPEQEYLAERLQKLGIAPFSRQKDFKPDMISKVDDCRGLSDGGFSCDFSRLFGLFKSE